ncbi:MAG TPA: cytochrome c biogenesis protein ResB [Geobacteraceae bacterium]
MTTTQRSITQTTWDFFCSLKLSIFLLISLAVTSIIGTVIPQGNIPPEYLQTISEAKFKLYQSLGFFDMYHSWWFILLLYLLTVNLIACSIKRLPRVWKIVTEPTLLMDEGLEKSLSLTCEQKLTGDPNAVRDKLKEFLKSNFAEPVITEDGNTVHLFAQKNPWCRLGVYVVHFSIIVVFIGTLIGSFFGYKGFVNIVEGSSTSSIFTRTEKQIPLDFSLHLEKFTVSFYDTGAPKEFKSILTVMENGKPVPGYEKVPVIVNDPLTYKGITFYQSSYGVAGEGSAYHFKVRSRKGGEPTALVVRSGEKAALPGGGFLQVLEATQDVRPFVPQFSGPAAKVQVSVPGKNIEPFIVFKNYPELDEQRGGDSILQYEGSDEKLYTGLQVAKDPGVWIVWFGCALMTIGIMMAFFLSHNRVWIRIGHGRIVMGGTASKNPAAFQGRFDELADKLKKL